ncbi:MAG: ABC transporter ATP-binding protein [Lachnospiraceae bacterium]|nr:ABC transporter ATP-binding protein [Lachnospiraceae bacterium]
MIEIKNLKKCFDTITAVNDISLNIRENETFGLIGTNGAGKSTLLRMICDIYKPDQGEVIVDGENIENNSKMKQNIFYISDEQYFFQNANPADMIQYYMQYYPNFDNKRCFSLLDSFGLNPKRKLSGYSKGMRKQFYMICGISSGVKYLICDETFDGLDPVMRQAVKSLIGNDMMERGLTTIISSHNLRELEDICDCIGLLHQGGILLSDELENLKSNLHKVQCVFKEDLPDPLSSSNIPDGIKIIYKEERGRLLTITLEGNRELINSWFQSFNPIFYEMIPLTLEEIFISKTKEAGYNVKSIIF